MKTATDATASFIGGLDDLERMRGWLDSVAAGEGRFDEKTASRLRLALTEAFTNAVLHGHGGAAGLPVDIRIQFAAGPGRLMRLDVTDQGPGFVPADAGVAGEDAESGRGLMILRALSERLEYRNNTLTIWMRAA